MFKRRRSSLLLSLASGALASATGLPACGSTCAGLCGQPPDLQSSAQAGSPNAEGGASGSVGGPCAGHPCGVVIRPGNVAGAAGAPTEEGSAGAAGTEP